MGSRFISGIYNHCDAWCERCRYTDRCLVFAQIRHHEARAAGRPSRDPLQELRPPSLEAEELLRELEEAQRSVTDEDLRIFELERESVTARIRSDEAAMLAGRLSRSLWTWRAPESADSDLLLSEARAVIGHYGVMLGPKTHRALHGYYEKMLLGDRDMFDADSVATAKVVLHAIDALRPAIETLALAYSDEAVLRAALAELPVLESMIEARFPGAKAFQRAGLDADVPGGAIDNSQ